MVPAEMDLIINEEFAADNEEQEDTHNHIRQRAGNIKVLADLGRALVQQLNQCCRQDHRQWVKFPQPADHDRCESFSSYRLCSDRVIQAGSDQIACQAAQRA